MSAVRRMTANKTADGAWCECCLMGLEGDPITADIWVKIHNQNFHQALEMWHAEDCGGTCDGCGHIAADGFWYNAPCPDALLQYQIDWAENGVPNAVRTK